MGQIWTNHPANAQDSLHLVHDNALSWTWGWCFQPGPKDRCAKTISGYSAEDCKSFPPEKVEASQAVRGFLPCKTPSAASLCVGYCLCSLGDLCSLGGLPGQHCGCPDGQWSTFKGQLTQNYYRFALLDFHNKGHFISSL